MNALHAWLAEPWVEPLGQTLLHFVWQGAVLGVLAWAILRLTHKRSANVRYLLAGMLMLALPVAPVVTFLILSKTPPVPVQTPAPVVSVISGLPDGVPVMNGPTETPAPMPVENLSAPKLVTVTQPTPQVREQKNLWWTQALTVGSRWMVPFWLVGILCMAARLGLGWLRIRGWQNSATATLDTALLASFQRLAGKFKLGAKIRLLISEKIPGPVTFGWARPAVLLPAQMLTGLPPELLEALLAHELAHIARRDYLANLVQSAIEVVLFYHPAVWWLGARVREIREECCDELAVRACGDRLTYARALESLAGLQLAAEPAAAASGGNLLARISRIVGRPSSAPKSSARHVAGLLILVGFVVGLIVSLSPVHLQAQAQAPKVASVPVTPPQTASDVIVNGEVKQPIIFPLDPGSRPIYLSEAILQAGFTDWSDHTVQLMRYDKDGKMTTMNCNVDDVLVKALKDKDVKLQPGDHIYVKKLWYTFGGAAAPVSATPVDSTSNPLHPAPLTPWPTSAGGNGHIYQAVEVPGGISWADALAWADAHGGYLTTIQSAAENEFVFHLIDDPKYWTPSGTRLPSSPRSGYSIVNKVTSRGPWLGGVKLPNSTKPDQGWTWTHGGGPFTYTHWAEHEPNNEEGDEDRMVFFSWGENKRESFWNDKPGVRNFPLGFVVEYDTDPSNSTSPAANTPAPMSQPVSSTKNAEAEKLIDELVNVDTETANVNTKTSSMSKFLANDQPPVLLSSFTKAELPPTPPVMRQIVEMGVAAVPSLLDHLTDGRETKLIISNAGSSGNFSGSMWYSDEYDPRYRDEPARMPQNVNKMDQASGPPIYYDSQGEPGIIADFPHNAYTVRVGDLCYALLGQIVGRSLTAVRSQPTSCRVINSPVHTPALAEAARQDWAGLTAEQHQASLEYDLTSDAHRRLQMVNYGTQHKDAAERLSFYYPKAVKADVTTPATTSTQPQGQTPPSSTNNNPSPPPDAKADATKAPDVVASSSFPAQPIELEIKTYFLEYSSKLKFEPPSDLAKFNDYFDKFIGQQGVDLMSAPKIVALAGKEARIFVGQTFGGKPTPKAGETTDEESHGQKLPGSDYTTQPVGLTMTLHWQWSGNQVEYTGKESLSSLEKTSGTNTNIVQHIDLTEMLLRSKTLLDQPSVYYLGEGKTPGRSRATVLIFKSLGEVVPGGASTPANPPPSTSTNSKKELKRNIALAEAGEYVFTLADGKKVPVTLGMPSMNVAAE